MDLVYAIKWFSVPVNINPLSKFVDGVKNNEHIDVSNFS
jgi:hypothetical protein